MRTKWLLIPTMLALAFGAYGQSSFYTSLHFTREGKRTAYKAENGGMERITGLSMDSLACLKCHPGTLADGTAIVQKTYTPSCNDCHNFSAGNQVPESICYKCHNRQNYERQAIPDSLANGDVHRKKGMQCMNCHKKEEVHGDGVNYASWLDPGASKVKCTDCHPLNSLQNNTSHTMHAQSVSCTACHTETILACVNCHFESLVASEKNRAMKQIKGFELLIKHNGQVTTGSFITHTYDGKSNITIAPYRSHLIVKKGKNCADCHYNMGASNRAIKEYNETGAMTLAKWDTLTKLITGPSGVIPIPADYQKSLKVDYAGYSGDPKVFPNDQSKWYYLKSTSDNIHMYYAEPLDAATMQKLGFTRTPSSVASTSAAVPTSFNLQQNYPNPFNPSTTLRFELPHACIVHLKVYDVAGREVSTLLSSIHLSSGQHKVTYHATNAAAGVYYAVLQAGDQKLTRKMLLIR